MSVNPDAALGVSTPEEFGAIEIDRDAEVPIGVQLAWALRSRIDDGRLVPGQRLPGLRELAEVSGVNVNTVRTVYQRLEQEGLIDSQQGSGTFVTAAPPRRSSVSAIAASAAREALETGVDPREVAAALYVAPEASPTEADERALRRRLLRAQIGELERTLGEMEAAHPGVSPAPDSGRRGIGPALLSVEELEQVRGVLLHRLAAAQARLEEQRDASGAEEVSTARAPRRKSAPAPTAQSAATTAKSKRKPFAAAEHPAGAGGHLTQPAAQRPVSRCVPARALSSASRRMPSTVSLATP
jgi:DNA-binding transcriptional regulator YhcF (GntR family)